MTSDTEYVEKLVKGYERRKMRAAFYGLASIVFAAFAYFTYVKLDEKTHEVTSSITSAISKGQVLTDIDIELVETNNRLSYVLGFRVGQQLNMLATTSGITLGYCMYLLFWSRKERIIKELYEKTKI